MVLKGTRHLRSFLFIIPKPRNYFTSVTDVEYIKDYTMRLEFSNGKTKVVDFLYRQGVEA